MKTWQKEVIVVGIILFGTALIMNAKPNEYIGSLAVLFTFMHAQVGFRFSEAAQNQISEPVTCHRWSTRYFLCKEILWFSYFALLGAWSALIGVFVFLLYPFWRRHYRIRRGCKTVSSL